MFYTYLVTNIINGKQYIGQTELTPEQRLREHIYSKLKKDYFHAAIRKHGKAAFTVERLGTHETQEETDYAEIFWIEHLETCNREIGYNTTYGGRYGGKPNEATRAKIGAYSRTRVHNQDTREKMRQSHLDKSVPENLVGARGVSIPVADSKAFRARSKANGHEICFGASRDVEEAKRLRDVGMVILQSLSPEELVDLVGDRKCVSTGRWKQWTNDWMDAQHAL